jgi:hypothetical protein
MATPWLKTIEIDFLMVPEARSLKLRCQHGWFLQDSEGQAVLHLSCLWAEAGRPQCAWACGSVTSVFDSIVMWRSSCVSLLLKRRI